MSDYYLLVDDNNNLCKEVKQLQQENKQLQTKIGKAIEYMNSLEFFELMNNENKEDYFKAKNKLLEILGDKE